MKILVILAGAVQPGKIQYHVEHSPAAEYHLARRLGMKMIRRLRIASRSCLFALWLLRLISNNGKDSIEDGQ